MDLAFAACGVTSAVSAVCGQALPRRTALSLRYVAGPRGLPRRSSRKRCERSAPRATVGARAASAAEVRGVVITGASKGIGFALAKKFVELGHNVVICARNEDNLKLALAALRKQADDGAETRVFGTTCDVADGGDVQRLVDFVRDSLSHVDIWINNAGTTGYVRRPLTEIDPQSLKETVSTNLLGSLLCTRAAMLLMKQQQPPGGHVFNVEGAGSFGDATAGYVAYGATKSAIPQLSRTLKKEAAGGTVGCHVLSPGMVLTDLLLADSTPTFRRFFNFLAEEPDTVAENLVPRVLNVSGNGKAVRFLTLPVAFLRIATGVLFRRNRFFDSSGKRVPVPGADFTENGVRRPYESTQQ